MNNIFITGGTGFLGSTLINEILSSSDATVHALIRDIFGHFGRKRLLSILAELNGGRELDDKAKSRIKTYAGDITHKDLGLAKEAVKDLTGTVDAIYHCAAATDLNPSLKKARKVNVDGTAKVLEFALLCKERGTLKKVNHISTAYIAGNKICVFRESDFDVGQRFNNTYEQSKFEGERVVHEYRKKGLDIDIFRPSIIMGRYTDGKTTRFRMFYQPLHFFSRELLDKIPAREHSWLNMINVDIAARSILLISNSSDKQNMTYHIVSPKSTTCEDFIESASSFFGFKKPEMINPESLNMRKEYSFVEERMISLYVPYLNYLTTFDMENTKAGLKKYNFRFPEINGENMTRLFKYCEKVGFVKRRKHAAG